MRSGAILLVQERYGIFEPESLPRRIGLAKSNCELKKGSAGAFNCVGSFHGYWIALRLRKAGEDAMTGIAISAMLSNRAL